MGRYLQLTGKSNLLTLRLITKNSLIFPPAEAEAEGAGAGSTEAAAVNDF